MVRGTVKPAACGRLSDALRAFIADAAFPCVGAKGALAHDAIQIQEYGALGSRANDAPLLRALTGFAAFVEQRPSDDATLHSFAAVFAGPLATDERRFEALLWAQLQRLHDLDVRAGSRWASDVSDDPADAHFSLSLAGQPLFVVGLHPGASRQARRFGWPALVFNPHRQFQRLRADGRYEKLQAAIRPRDVDLQGSINPNLADFGQASEARQYSGRAVEPGWQCPLRVRKGR
ncbi:MAG: YqcI/YcgG family protein [Xanthomonadales bacterium]|nr:YqcI/YcgG family protein [Xanthomonadales bacterium]